MIRFLSFLTAALFLGTAAHGSGKSNGAYIGIHVEGDENEGARMVIPNVIDGEKHFFRILPDVSTRHFDAFHAFVAEDGASFGAALHLTEEGRRAMTIMCSTSGGKLARTVVNSRAVDILRIDSPGTDGYFIVWSGLTEADFKLFGKKLKRLDKGTPREKKR